MNISKDRRDALLNIVKIFYTRHSHRRLEDCKPVISLLELFIMDIGRQSDLARVLNLFIG